MTATPNFDEIPVLTEVVAEDAEEAGAATQPAIGAAAAPQAPAAPAGPLPAQPVPAQDRRVQDRRTQAGALDGDAWRTLEERLVARVLDRLLPRIDVVLEDQVRSQMAVVLDHVAERLGAEMRAALQQSIEHVVARAVEQELAHLNARQG